MQPPYSLFIGPVAGFVLFMSGAVSTLAQETTPETEHAARDRLVEGNAQFAVDLYGQLREEDGNLLISPHSISTALAMIWAGAQGETRDQMTSVLRFTMPYREVHSSFQELREHLQAIQETEKGSELHLASRLWGDRQILLRDPFLQTMRQHYQGGVERVDFVNAVAQARHRINTWIEQQTDHRIVELLRSSEVSPSTMLVLTNALYFKGLWSTRFEKEDTSEGDFFTDPRQAVTVPMMAMTESLAHYRNDRLQVVELPYADERFSMVLLVPLERNGLADLEQDLSAKLLAEWIGGLEERTVHLILPRFRIARHLHLHQALSRMGMPLAFTPGKADLSGIGGTPGQLWIDLVVHQTYLEVDEVGAEASGATAVVLNRGGGPPIIRADRPFLFLIRDRRTESILFLGRCSNPKGG